jgi:hypothetical protein
MKPTLLGSVMLGMAVLFPWFPARASDPVAGELVRKVVDARKSASVTIRGRLVVADSSTDRRSSVQFRMRGRRDGELGRRLYQVLWPASRFGQALYFERTDGGAVSGFLFEPPDRVTPLTPELLAGPFLDSDLSIDDLAEDFLQWPAQTIGGEETVNGEPCTIVESRPPADRPGGCSLIRSWISPDKLLPLRIEKFDREGSLAKRFVFRKLVQRDQIWTPAITVVQTPGSTRETTLEISRGDRDVDLPLEEFSLENIKKFAQRTAQESDEASAARRGSPGHK